MKRFAAIALAFLLGFGVSELPRFVSADTNGSSPLFVQHSASVPNPCANPFSTIASLTGTTSGTSLTQIIALSGTTKIYICSLSVIAGGGTSPTFQLEYGTGTNCASGTTAFTQAIPVVTTSIFVFSNPVGVTTAGQALCYVVGGTSTPTAKYQIVYVQT